jgi:hypothetical protein
MTAFNALFLPDLLYLYVEHLVINALIPSFQLSSVKKDIRFYEKTCNQMWLIKYNIFPYIL